MKDKQRFYTTHALLHIKSNPNVDEQLIKYTEKLLCNYACTKCICIDILCKNSFMEGGVMPARAKDRV